MIARVLYFGIALSSSQFRGSLINTGESRAVKRMKNNQFCLAITRRDIRELAMLIDLTKVLSPDDSTSGAQTNGGGVARVTFAFAPANSSRPALGDRARVNRVRGT